MTASAQTSKPAWLRGLVAVPAGFVIWAGGLMALVTVLFLGDNAAFAPVAFATGAIGAAALAFVIPKVTRFIGGPAGRPATIAVGLLVLAIGALNVTLGVAVEPVWFTATVVSIGAGGILWQARQTTAPDPTPHGR